LARLRAALIGATVLALAGTAAAQSKVGVTSATDGDPLGKPPAQAERILKIGIDVQANEVVTTHANDRAHLVFLDGSSLTVGPNARLTIDKFVYDPNSKTGELALTATQGVFRLVGGKISKTNPITINTPSGTIGIRGGITIFNVSNSRTVANFIFGHNLTMSSQGVSQNVTRAGSFVIANAGATPSPPSLLPPGGLNALVGQLEGGGSSTGGGTGGGGAGGSGSGTGGNADQKSQSSGFSSNNSGSGGSGAPPAINNPPNAIPGNPTGNPNITTQPIANSNKADNPTATQVFVPPTTVTTQVQTGYTNGLIIGTNGSIVTTRLPAIDANLPTDFAIATASVSGPFGTAGAAAARIIIRGLDGTLSSPNATLQLGGSTTNSTFFNDSNYATADVNRQGTVANPVMLPNTQSATYTGFMAGMAQLRSNNAYFATGDMTINWSFNRGAGSVGGTFDNKAYSGALAITPGTPNVSGQIQMTGGPSVSGPLTGSFFSSPTDPAKYIAGAFGVKGTVSGTPYAAGGVFATQR
jgi:hypothetical protein